MIEIFILSKYLPKKTRKGVLCYEKVLGYKMFLDATEKDRLKTMYGPKDYSGVFEKHLPYAIAMGVEESWIEQFGGLYDMEMDWYDSTGPLTHHIFLSELMTFNKLAENSIKGPSDS